MYQQINRMSVIFDSSIARFACLKEINYTCTVCLLQFAKNDHLVQLSCNPTHTFHAECLAKWAECNYTCPVCRQAVIGGL